MYKNLKRIYYLLACCAIMSYPLRECCAGMQDITLEQMQEIIRQKGANWSSVSDYDKTLLIYAVKAQRKDIVALLLENGADVNKNDRIYYTPLMYAVKNNDYEMSELLLKNGANPNIGSMTDFLDTANELPLKYAVRQCNKQLIDLLLSYKARTDFTGGYFASGVSNCDESLKKFVASWYK